MRRTLLTASLVAGVTLAGGTLPAEAPQTWGTAPGYTLIMNYEFHPARPDSYWLVNDASQGSWCTGADNGECLGYAQIHAPEGAILVGLDLWLYDVSPESDLHYALLSYCEGPAGPVNDILDSGNVVQEDGEFHYAVTYTPGHTVNNSACGYTLRLKFTDSGEPPRGNAIRIRKARLTWKRQVSPAPATASFDDVPVSHPFFQFVEALVRSGITVGCGLDSFCPDEPLTRGQMAVFLSKALGLEWPIPSTE